jgi:Kdo2-lipid IVA lauroyltransferase/acyltransferase
LIHRIQYALYRGLAGMVLVLPESLALAVGSALGWLGGSVFRIRRRVVDENLRRAFPDRDPAWRRRVASACYRHLGRQAVVFLRLSRMGAEVVRARTEVVGFDEVVEAADRGSGVVFATGHLGNWELGGAAVAVRGVPLDVVARRQRNPWFDRHIRRTRERLGMRVIYRDEATREALRTLRGGGAVALAADQHAPTGALLVDFFGVPAATARGPALLALRTGAPLITAFSTALSGAPGRYRVRFEALRKPDTGDPDEDLRLLTRAYLAALEEAIRETPEQYFWLHRRWKARPEGAVGNPGTDFPGHRYYRVNPRRENPLIYLTVPVHDEEKTIGVLLWKLRKVMAEFERDYRILLLDDASTDGTAAVVARYSGYVPLTLIRSRERLGHGRALERLLREAAELAPYPKRDVVVTLQGDFTENPDDLVPLVKAIEGGADLVAGALDPDHERPPAPIRFARGLARIVLGRTARSAPVADPLSGFRAYRVVVLKKALRDLDEGEALVSGDGWSAHVELLRRAVPHARRIEEAPYRVRYAHRERASRFKVLQALRALIPLRRSAWNLREEGT